MYFQDCRKWNMFGCYSKYDICRWKGDCLDDLDVNCNTFSHFQKRVVCCVQTVERMWLTLWSKWSIMVWLECQLVISVEQASVHIRPPLLCQYLWPMIGSMFIGSVVLHPTCGLVCENIRTSKVSVGRDWCKCQSQAVGAV